MKKLLMGSVIAVLFTGAPVAYADDAHHPEKEQKAMQAATAKPADVEPAADQRIKQAQETMRKLQELMGKIHQTSDPVERQKLMQEHMRAMREGMKQMRGMGGGMMMGMGGVGKQGMMMGMAREGKQGGMMMGGDTMRMHDMMEMRMEMMGVMMEQMMQREEMRGAMPAK